MKTVLGEEKTFRKIFKKSKIYNNEKKKEKNAAANTEEFKLVYC